MADLEICQWRDEAVYESFSPCIRPEDHEGNHVLAIQGPSSVRFYEVTDRQREMNINRPGRTNATLEPLIFVDLKPGPEMTLEELAAIWAVMPSGQHDYSIDS